jgi:hypothetical protein
VTDVESVAQGLESLGRMFTEALAVPRPTWLDRAETLWSGPVAEPKARVAVPIWRDPWMVVGSRTFAGDLLARLGMANAFAESTERYPTVAVADIDGRPDLDLVLLPDEPYVFTASDGPEAFTRVPTALVSGRLLTWYGPSLVEAHAVLGALAS